MKRPGLGIKTCPCCKAREPPCGPLMSLFKTLISKQKWPNIILNTKQRRHLLSCMQHYAKNQGVAVPQYVLPESCGFDYRLSKSFNYQTFFNPLQYLCGHPKGQEPHVEDHESLILPLFYPPLIHQCKLKDRSHMLDIINSLQKGKITHLCVSQAAVPPDLTASHCVSQTLKDQQR